MAIQTAQPTGRSRWALYCPVCGRDIEVSVKGDFLRTAPEMPVPQHAQQSHGGSCSGVGKLATPQYESEYGFSDL